MQYYIGIDIGTSSTKLVAFDKNGNILNLVTEYYPMLHPMPDRSEQDPEQVFAAIRTGLGKLIANRKGRLPVLVSFCSAMHSLIAVDKKGCALTQVVIWADNRAAAVAKNLRNSDLGKKFYKKSGVPVHPMSPLCKLIWYRQEEPELFRKANRWVGIKEYIWFLFFGEWIVDTSIASATGLLNLDTLQWDTEILEYAGIKEDQLPQLVSPSYKVEKPLSSILPGMGFPDESIPFCIGGSDGALSNLGSGADGPSDMAVTIGTSSAARILVEKPERDPLQRSFCYHVNKGTYILGGAANNGAVVLQWMKDKVLETNESYEQLYQLAETVEPGGDGLIFLPYLLGERAPLWNPEARGILFGLNIHHGKAAIVRAAMESVIYCVYSYGKLLIEKRKVDKIFATGGFIQCSWWVQMLADLFNIPVFVSANEESAAWGAVLLGMESMGIAFPEEKRIIARYLPDKTKNLVYLEAFKKFSDLSDRFFKLPPA